MSDLTSYDAYLAEQMKDPEFRREWLRHSKWRKDR